MENACKYLDTSMKTFKKWLEDAGEGHLRINDDSYAEKGAKSQMQPSKKPGKSKFNPKKLFGKMSK